MSEVATAGEGKVSGDQVSIPVNVRRALGIEDGDVLRWSVVEGELEVRLVQRRGRAFAEFEPGASDGRVDVVGEHDRFGVE